MLLGGNPSTVSEKVVSAAKYFIIPIPGDTTTLDFNRLLSEAKEEKAKLIEEIQTLLGETTRLKQLERKNQESQQTQEIFGKVPYPIYIM